MQDSGIIHNRAKIVAAINNAKNSSKYKRNLAVFQIISGVLWEESQK